MKTPYTTKSKKSSRKNPSVHVHKQMQSY